jgi:hypothetical protein
MNDRMAINLLKPKERLNNIPLIKKNISLRQNKKRGENLPNLEEILTALSSVLLIFIL